MHSNEVEVMNRAHGGDVPRTWPDALDAPFEKIMRKHAYIEDIESVPPSFDATGPLRVRYGANAIDISFQESSKRRLLVFNMMPLPAWNASSNGERLKVYAANGVMTAVVIPPFSRGLTLRFTPFSSSAWGVAILISGLVLLGVVVVVGILPGYRRPGSH